MGVFMASIYDFSVDDIHGKQQKLADYKDKVLLVVNVASKCGFTPQYEGLEKLQREMKGKAFSTCNTPVSRTDPLRHDPRLRIP